MCFDWIGILGKSEIKFPKPWWILVSSSNLLLFSSFVHVYFIPGAIKSLSTSSKYLVSDVPCSIIFIVISRSVKYLVDLFISTLIIILISHHHVSFSEPFLYVEINHHILNRQIPSWVEIVLDLQNTFQHFDQGRFI